MNRQHRPKRREVSGAGLLVAPIVRVAARVPQNLSKVVVLCAMIIGCSVAASAVLGLGSGQRARAPRPAAGASRPLGLRAPPSLGAVAHAQPRPRPELQVERVEHDDWSIRGAAHGAGTVRHAVRATVPPGLSGADLRRSIDHLIDDERLVHPQVDSVAVYLYEAPVYATFSGRTTPLEAAVARAVWAPGGEWARPARRVSGVDNRTVYLVPGR